MILISKTYWLGMPFNYKGDLPVGTQCSPVYLSAFDMRGLHGLFYRPPESRRLKVGVLVMHPRADFTRHYCIPGFVAAGVSVLGLQTRCINNDTTAIHEDLILDVAAGVKHLKENGCDQVVLFGNSGGGSLFCFYQAQAEKAQGQRLTTDPSGKPTKLNAAEMIPADLLLAVSAHPGEGHVLMGCIDPAVVDEADPLTSDASLDMYNPDNGFAPPPEPSQYGPEFVSRYRAAQKARVEKLDGIARAFIDDAREAEEQYKAGKGKLPFAERQELGRRAAFEPVMTIYRTMANLNYTDPSLDPSRRGYGSLFSERPDLMNFQYIGFCRQVTPAAWLSTWSGLSSNADFCRNARQISCPVLLANALRDKEIYPGEAKLMWESLQGDHNAFLEIDAEHYFEPEFGATTAPDVDRLMAEVVPWVLAHCGY